MTPRLTTLKTTVIGGRVYLLPRIVAVAALDQALAVDFGRLNQALSGIGRGTAALVD